MIIDSTLIAGILTSFATVATVLIAYWLNKNKSQDKNKGDHKYNDIESSKDISLHKYYRIITKHSNKCISIQDDSKDIGHPIIQLTCSEEKESNKWKFKKDESGYYRIVSKHSDMCLNVCEESKDSGERIIQYKCGVDKKIENDLWMLKRAKNREYYRIIAKHSQLCLSVENNSSKDGEIIIQSSYESDTDVGLWKLEEVGKIYV
jgi:hypothetical protein